jgi:glycerol-3-phosphate acyltransferase PlsX
MATIVLDALGGSHAPHAPVEAAAIVSRTTENDVVLVGPADPVSAALSRTSYDAERLRVRGCADDPLASMDAAVRMVQNKEADALVTAGHASDLLRACIRRFKLVPGARRSPLAAVIPTAPRVGNPDPFALILDVGASLRPEASDLVAWARMGAAYASRISHVEAPTVGLLSVGRDPGAGTPTLVQAHQMLAADPTLRFVGNIEAIDIPRGEADVVVCDGFTGQVIVSLLGGVGDALLSAARGAWEQRLTWRMGLRLLEDAVVGFQEVVTHRYYGGAPLLGFDRVAILAVETATSPALVNAVKLASKSVRTDVAGAVARALAP